MKTHDVVNQAPEFDGYDLYAFDRALKASVNAEGADWADNALSEFGRQLGNKESFDLGHLANKFTPELNAFDARGFRADQVEFHPSYHHFMALSKTEKIHVGSFESLAKNNNASGVGSGIVRAAKLYMVGQVEAGHVCPITMTHAAIPALMVEPDIADKWLPKIISTAYDPAFKPWYEKEGVTIGMGMTEKQGGTDVRTNTTTATPVATAGHGQVYEITGHKWFMSAPMCDAFLVLAQAEKGLSVFLIPRFKEDGQVNNLQFQRLKNKLGNRSNASSEVEFHQAHGYLLGDEGRGIPNIMTMANFTRLDCALGSAGQMRQALHRAWHHISYRTVFNKKLIDQPMMTALLADLVLESEACTLLAMRLAGAYDKHHHGDKNAEQYARVMTPIAKYWVTKRAPEFAYEAMEIHGGNGYVEDGVMARLYRDLPVNSIWEGSGNVMALDLMRVMSQEQEVFERFIQDLSMSKGRNAIFDTALGELIESLAVPIEPMQGRWLMERLAQLEAARLMMDRAPAVITESYIRTRLDGHFKGGTYGILPAGTPAAEIIGAALG